VEEQLRKKAVDAQYPATREIRKNLFKEQLRSQRIVRRENFDTPGKRRRSELEEQ